MARGFPQRRGPHKILKLRPDGYVERVAGGVNRCADIYGKRQWGYRDGTREEALFNEPSLIALDPDGNLFVADSGNFALRKIDGNGRVSTVFQVEGCQQPELAKAIGFARLATDSQGRVYLGGNFLRMHCCRCGTRGSPPELRPQ